MLLAFRSLIDGSGVPQGGTVDPVIRSTSVGSNGGTATSFNVPKPAGLTAGDLMIAIHGGDADQTLAAMGPPSGFVVGGSQTPNVSSNIPAMEISSKVATSGDAAATNFAFSCLAGGADSTAIIIAIQVGTFDTSTPLSFGTFTGTARVLANLQTASSVTGVADQLLLAIFGTDTNNTSESYPSGAPPSGMTFVQQVQSAGLYSMIGVYSQLLSAGGATGAKSVNTVPQPGVATNGWTAVQVAVNPAVAVGYTFYPSSTNLVSTPNLTVGGAVVQSGAVSLSATPTLSTDGTVSSIYPTIRQGADITGAPGANANTGTLGSAAIAGNLLAYFLAGDKNTGTITMSDNIGGAWSKPVEVLGASVSTYVTYKVAVGGETAITGTTTATSVSGNRGRVIELQQTGSDAWSLLGSATPTYSDVAATSLATGATGTTTAAGLGIAIATMDSVSAVPTVGWTNGFTSITGPTIATGGPAGIWLASAAIASGSTASTTFSYTVAGSDQIHDAVVVFGRAAPVTQSGAVSLSVVPSLTANGVREQSGAVSLTTAQALSADGVRVQPGAVSLSAVATLSSTATLGAFAAVSLVSGKTLSVAGTLEAFGAVALPAASTLSVNGVRTTSGAVSLSASSTLSVQPFLGLFGAVNLAATSVLTSNGVASTSGAVSLVGSAILTTFALLPSGSANLSATGILTVAGVRATSGTVSLSVIGALTANALLVEFAAVSLGATAALSLTSFLNLPAALSLTTAQTLSVAGVRSTDGTVSLSALPVLTLNASILSGSGVLLAASSTLSLAGRLGAFGAVVLTTTQSLSGLGNLQEIGAVSLAVAQTLSVSAGVPGGAVSLSVAAVLSASSIRVISASVALSAATSVSINTFQNLTAVLSLSITSGLNINGIREIPGAVSLAAVGVLTAAGTTIAAGLGVTLVASSTLSVTGRLGAFGSVTLTAVPVLTSTVTVRVTNGSATLSVLSSLSAGGVRITNVVVGGVPLVTVQGLNVDGTIVSGGSANLNATPVLSVSSVLIRFGSAQLSSLPSLLVGARLGAFAAIELVATGGISTAGTIVRVGSINLSAVGLLSALSSGIPFGSISMVALGNLFFVDLFPEVEFSDAGSWTFGGIGVAGRGGEGIHRDVRPIPRTSRESEWTTAGIHSTSAWSS